MVPRRHAPSSSSTKLRSNMFFSILGILVALTLTASIVLGLFVLYIHPEEIWAGADGRPSTGPSSTSSSLMQLKDNKATNGINSGNNRQLGITPFSSSKYANAISSFLSGSLSSSSSDGGGSFMSDPANHIPYTPPFAPIPNGEALAANVLDGSHPTIGGIAHILQTFVRDLRHSNKRNQDVSNDRAGEDVVRNSFFDLATKHLLPLDEPYRGRTVFPVRVEEESIFMSLAAFREHLLYETLAGAFGQATYPERLFVGIVMQNCFGLDDETGEVYGCRTGAQVIGKDKNGRDMTKVSDAPPDINGVEKFCNDTNFVQYCTKGQLRVLSVHESEALGPAVARYYASKLWGGETYFLQVDAHLQFTKQWDVHYVNELKATKNFPFSVLSMYPPGFGNLAGETPGTRLCTCEFSKSDVEDSIIRINNGMSYDANKVYDRPTQIAFIAAGFFMARAEFLRDIPFDPFLPWCFMGEEIALSMRAWTSGWNIYAPRKNWIAHQYRPGRMGLPKFWGSVGRTFKRGLGFSNRLQAQLILRIKYLIGYPELQSLESLRQLKLEHVLIDMQYYGLGTNRTQQQYASFANIDFQQKVCRRIVWCNRGTLE